MCAGSEEWGVGLGERARRCDGSPEQARGEGAGGAGARAQGCVCVVGAGAEATGAAMRGTAHLPSRFGFLGHALYKDERVERVGRVP